MPHYFTEPAAAEQRRTVTAKIWGQQLVFETANEVFSASGLDKATAVLLKNCLPRSESKNLLDLGCGWGPIACSLAKVLPQASIWAIDTNQRALSLTRDNALRLGVGNRIKALSPEAVPDQLAFDEIWSNPPIRIGKKALHELLTFWFSRLESDGVARIVVGKNLGADSLQKWLSETGWSCEKIGSAKGFRVFEIRRK